MADGNYQQRNNAPKKERAQHSLNDFRFRLTGKRLEGATKPCQIGFDIDRDGLKVTAITNVDGDKDYGKIHAVIPLADSMVLMTMLERAPRLPPGKHEELAIAGGMYDHASGSRKVKHMANIRIGRRDTGVIYITVSSWESTRPVVSVDMLPSNFVKLIDMEGNPAPADKVSELWAVQWSKWLSALFPVVLNAQYETLNADFLARSRSGAPGGGSGGDNAYPRGNTNTGGGRPTPAPAGNSGGFNFDGDDLPM